jgi:ankyrin repeat protein
MMMRWKRTLGLLGGALLATALGAWALKPSGGQVNKPLFTDPKLMQLQRAIENQDAAGVQAALASGAPVNGRGRQQITPLMLAVDILALDPVLVLLKAGADPNLQADDGNSAVSLAVANYRRAPEVMRAVFAAGGNPNMRRPDDDPVIMRFVNDRSCEHIRYMKSLGADLEITTRTGDSLVSDTAVSGDWDVTWCLLELGANPTSAHSRLPLIRLLRGTFPAPDSPIYPYKLKVWQLMKDRGHPVEPLPPAIVR